MSGYIVPALAALLILYGLVKRIDVYEAFAEGAAEGLPVLVHILPYLAAMLIAVRLLTDGGLLDGFARLLAPACAALNMDAELMPLLLVRPFSGSGAMATFCSKLGAGRGICHHSPGASPSTSRAIIKRRSIA